MTFYDVFVIQRAPDGAELHAERVSSHTLQSEAIIAQSNMRRSWDSDEPTDKRGVRFSVKIRKVSE